MAVDNLPWQVFGRREALRQWKATNPDPVVYGYVENELGKWENHPPEGAFAFCDYVPGADPELFMYKVPFVDIYVTFLVGSDIREKRIIIRNIAD